VLQSAPGDRPIDEDLPAERRDGGIRGQHRRGTPVSMGKVVFARLAALRRYFVLSAFVTKYWTACTGADVRHFGDGRAGDRWTSTRQS
jgi:hypothetical protein